MGRRRVVMFGQRSRSAVNVPALNRLPFQQLCSDAMEGGSSVPWLCFWAEAGLSLLASFKLVNLSAKGVGSPWRSTGRVLQLETLSVQCLATTRATSKLCWVLLIQGASPATKNPSFNDAGEQAMPTKCPERPAKRGRPASTSLKSWASKNMKKIADKSCPINAKPFSSDGDHGKYGDHWSPPPATRHGAAADTLHHDNPDAPVLLGRPATSIRVNLSHEPYQEFLSILMAEVSSTEGCELLWHHTLLPEQQLQDAPVKWIQLELLGRYDEEIKVMLRPDNLYLIGFTNRNNEWFETKDPNNHYVIPGSTPMPIGGSYPELLGRRKGKWGLKYLPLGKHFLLDAITLHYNYPYNSISNVQLGRAYAGLVAMISEAQRIIPIRNRIRSFWESNAYLNDDMAKYTVTWGKMSWLLLCWSHNYRFEFGGDNELKNIKIKTASDALKVVDIIIRTTRFDTNDIEGSCTPKADQ
ncbi:hypothetical protein ACP70R_024885 [Stipagrostis hirtigluma subsp. patula]